MTRFGFKARLAAAGAVVLALSACDDRGRVDVPEPPSLAELSAASELPYAEPARVDYRAPAESYAWAERAYGLQRAVYDTPPDYGFEYDGIEPLAWETEDDWAMYAEPWDDGYRYYYYEPGVDYPYFVREGGHGYAYDAGGILIAVFDSGGRYLPRDDARRFAPSAGRYWMRGHDLRAAAVRSRRMPVSEQVWVQRAPQVIRTADPWMRAAREDRAWRAWRERDQDRELRRFQREAERRDQRARTWRDNADRREVAAIQAQDRGWQRQAQQEQQRRQFARQEQQQQRRQAERAQDQRQRFAQQERAQVVARQDQQRRQAQTQQRAQQERGRQQAELQQRRQQQQAQQEQRRQVAQQQRAQMRQQGERQRHEQARAQEAQARQQAVQQQRAQQDQRRQQAQQAQRQQVREQAAQQQRAQHEQRQQAQQAQRQQLAQQQREQRQQQRQAQQQARAAGQHGQPAAARERGGGPDRGRGHDRKD